jgi:hypothetical protein
MTPTLSSVAGLITGKSLAILGATQLPSMKNSRHSCTAASSKESDRTRLGIEPDEKCPNVTKIPGEWFPEPPGPEAP